MGNIKKVFLHALITLTSGNVMFLSIGWSNGVLSGRNPWQIDTSCWINGMLHEFQTTSFANKILFKAFLCQSYIPRSYDCNSHVVCTSHVTVNLRQNYYESDYDKVCCKCALPIIIIMIVYRNHLFVSPTFFLNTLCLSSCRKHA
jgi:hypothetical protein